MARSMVEHVAGDSLFWKSRSFPLPRRPDELLTLGLGPSLRRLGRRSQASSFFGDGVYNSSAHFITQNSSSKSPAESVRAMQAKISALNSEAENLTQTISSAAEKIPSKRIALNQAMEPFLKELKPLCVQYMQHRAELAGLGYAHCEAAQGRLNSVELTADSPALPGCVSNAFGDGASPETLTTQNCTSGERQLACTARMKAMEDGKPAPGEKPNSSSIDDQVREWCHPSFQMPAQYIPREVASGEQSTSPGWAYELDRDAAAADAALQRK